MHCSRLESPSCESDGRDAQGGRELEERESVPADVSSSVPQAGED
jgi:hypothetical protein